MNMKSNARPSPLRRFRPAVRLSCAAWLALASVRCGADTDANNARTQPQVVVAPDALELPLSYRVSPDRSVIVTSMVTSDDGEDSDLASLRLRLDAGALARETSLSVARYRGEHTPRGVVGHAYLISPEVTRLNTAVRITLAVPAELNDEDMGFLRIARLDTDGEYYEALEGQALLRTPALRRVGGLMAGFGVFALVDTRHATITGELDVSDYWSAIHLLDFGYVSEAHALFEAAHAAAPTTATSVAYGLTRLLHLPQLPGVASFLTACGEPTWDPSALFGDSGYFSLDELRGRGTSTLRLGTGFDRDSTIERALQPTRIAAERLDEDLCLDTASDRVVQRGALLLDIVDPDSDGQRTRLRVQAWFDPAKPFRSSSAKLADMLASAGDDGVLLPMSDLNGGIEAHRGDVSTTSYSSNGGARPGVFVAVGAEGGIRVQAAGSTLGDAVRLSFEDVVLSPQWSMERPEVLVLNGGLSTILSEAPALDALPLGDDLASDRSFIDILSTCDRTQLPTLDDAYLRTLMQEVATEIEIVAALLAPSDLDSSLRFDVSLGLVRRPGFMRIGPVELHTLAAALDAAAAALHLGSYYRLFNTDLRDAVVTESVEIWPEDACGVSSRQSTTEVQKVLSSTALAAAMSQVLLVPWDGGADLELVRSLLDAALDHMLAALIAPVFDTPIGFQGPLAASGTEAFESLLDTVLTALSASSVLDGTSITTGESNVFFFLDDLFVSPPTAAQLRIDDGVPANEPAVTIDLADGKVCPTACVSLGDGSCTLSCVPEHLKSVVPADWLFGGVMSSISSDGSGITCGSAADCGASPGASCDASTAECVFVPGDDLLTTIGDSYFETSQPSFLNQRAMSEAAAAFGL